MWRKGLLLGFLGLICLGGLGVYRYSDEVIGFAAKWQMKRQGSKLFGGPLSYEALEVRNGTITILGPATTNDSFSAQELVISGQFAPWKKERSLDISLVRPTIRLTPELLTKGSKFASPKERKRSKTRRSWTIEQGVIELPSDHGEPTRLVVDGHGEMGGGTTGIINISLPHDPSSAVTFTLGQEGNTKTISFDLGNVACTHFFQGLSSIDKDLVANWLPTEGRVAGTGTLYFPKGKLPYVEGKLALHDLRVKHLPSGAEALIPVTTLALQRDLDEGQIAASEPGLVANLLMGTVGRLEIPTAGQIDVHPTHTSPWSLEGIVGAVNLRSNHLSLDLDAKLAYGQSRCWFGAEGRLQLGNRLNGDLKLAWLSASSSKPMSSSRLAFSEDRSGNQLLSLVLDNIGEEQAILFLAVASDLFPECQGVCLSDGTLSGRIDLLFQESEIREVAINRFSAEHLVFSVEPWQLAGRMDSAQGRFRARVTPEHRFTDLFGELQLEGGGIQFCDTEGQDRLLHDLKATLALSQGRMQKAHLSANLDGLEGSLEMDRKVGEGVRVWLSGGMNELSELLPPSVGEPIAQGFGQEFFGAEARISPRDDLFEIEGLCHVGEEDYFPFGLTLAHCPTEEAKASLNLWAQLGAALAESWAATSGPPTHSPFADPSRSVRIQSGWFEGQRLEATRYILPFIRRPKLTHVAGELDIRANFDNERLLVEYDASDLELECRSFAIEIPKVRNATHTINLRDGTESGQVQVQGGSYLEKKTGLAFNDTDCTIKLGGRTVELCDVTTDCFGVAMCGGVQVNDLGKGLGTDITITVPKADGPLAGLREILARVNNSRLWNLPVHGYGETIGDGAKLVLHLKQKEKKPELTVQMAMANASWELNDRNMRLSDVGAEIDFDLRAAAIKTTKMTGLCHIGDQSHPITKGEIEHIDKRLQFDLQLDNAAHLVGQSSLNEEGVRSCTLDLEKTHIGGIRPNLADYTIAKGIKPSKVIATPQFDLATLEADLIWLEPLGLRPLANQITKLLIGKAPSGQVAGTISLEEDGWAFQFTGEDLALHSRQVPHLTLNGRGAHDKWTIDHLIAGSVWGELSAEKVDDKWTLPLARLGLGHCAVVDLSGHIDTKGRHFVGNVNGAAVILDGVDNLLPEKVSATGRIALAGPFSLPLDHPTEWEGRLRLSMANVTINDIALTPMDELSVTLEPDGTAHLADFSLALFPTESQREAIRTTIADCYVSPFSREWRVDNVQFSCPVSLIAALPKVGGKALSKVKPEGEIYGSLKARNGEIALRLEDDTYRIAGRDLPLKDTLLTYEEDCLLLTTSTTFNNHPFWIAISPKERWAIVSDKEKAEPTQHPLTVKWGADHQIAQVEGALYGLSFNLQGGGRHTLNGSIAVNGSEAARLLSGKVGAVVEKVKLGDGYQLIGRFHLPPDDPKLFSFSGTAVGNNFILRNYELKHFDAACQITADQIMIRSINIDDPAGKVSIDRITAKKDNKGVWNFEIPSLKVSNLQPDRLHERGKTPRNKKPFVITQAEVTNIKANSGDLDSITGKGSIHFTTQAWRDPEGMLVVIEKELEGRRKSFDSRSLTPAEGTINFTLRDGRIALNKLQDTYSIGKRSRFYLSRQGPHYIDRHGNLNLGLRMKQTNLFLKLTEPFTLHISGSLDKPRYSLRSSPKRPVL